jgi:thiamine-monophosphate kinase
VKGEDRFLERLRELLSPSEAVRLGPGDDAAILTMSAGEVAVTTDTLVEGIDFLPGEDPERLGRRAVSVNLSDLAAMGARPEFFLLSLALPEEAGVDFALAITRGAIGRAAAHGAKLVGGDLSRAPAIYLSVCFWGRPAGAPLRRAGASPGDLLYVSGWPGEAAAGLRLARGGTASLSAPHTERLLAAYRDPEPRVELGLALARDRLASAAIDVSDGLGLDASRLARASGVRAVLERERLPLSEALVRFAEAEGLDPVDLALSGGDDYELLFAAPPSAAPRLERGGEGWGVSVTPIGRLEAGRGTILREPAGDRDVSGLGHDHFGETG